MKIMHSFVINKCTRIHLLLRFLIILHPLVSGVPICFFPADIQGKYLTQIEILENPSQVQYSSVNVTPTTISPWGDCYKRIGNNIILIDRNGCFRCVNMALRSINILVFHKSDKIDVCYNSTERAESSCLQNGYDTFRFNEIIIYRQDIIEEYCPIVGKFSLDMHKERLMEDGYGKDAGCLSNRFSVDSCPRASQLNIQLKECSSQNTDITFKCLGSWRKSNNENFLALFDTRNTLKQHPAYRCALYREETGTGIIHVALSSDSTCRSNLTNATYGSETFTLQARTPNVRLKQFQDHCSFPEWLQGHWQNVIVSERSFIYEDHTNFITYSLQCIQLEQSISNEDYKFILYGTTHCEEEVFTCVWIKKRATNVFEFNLSRMGSGHLNKSLCSQEEFSDIWITQGKLNTMEESSCPITGVFVGYIPETGDLCAKLSSNCTSPEIMRYEVITCKDELSLEGREYHCLGQWKEGNTIYTYTKRKDIANKYECFAGLAEANKILIYEAGDNICSRLPPIIPKMALYKQESCPKNEPVTIYNERYSVIPYQRNATVRSVTKRPPLTQPPLKTKRPTVHKKLQKPFVKPANQNNSSLSTRIRSCFYIFLMSFFITYF